MLFCAVLIPGTTSQSLLLTSPRVEQENWFAWNEFTFSVIYTQLDNVPPDTINAAVWESDDSGLCRFHHLSKVDSSDYDYTDGCMYAITLTLSSGTHKYAFCTYNGSFDNWTPVESIDVVDMNGIIAIVVTIILLIIVARVGIGVVINKHKKHVSGSSTILYARPSHPLTSHPQKPASSMKKVALSATQPTVMVKVCTQCGARLIDGKCVGCGQDIQTLESSLMEDIGNEIRMQCLTCGEISKVQKQSFVVETGKFCPKCATEMHVSVKCAICHRRENLSKQAFKVLGGKEYKCITCTRKEL